MRPNMLALRGVLIVCMLALVAAATGAPGRSTPAEPTATPPAALSASSSPSARRHSAIAYDAARRRVLLFGGVDNSDVVLDDLWSWNGTAWTRLAASTGSYEVATDMYATRTDVFSVSPTGRVQRLSGTHWV